MPLARLSIVLLFLTGCGAGLGLTATFWRDAKLFCAVSRITHSRTSTEWLKAIPAIVTKEVAPPRSIWTYIGRADYNAGKYAQAQSAFEKAVGQLKDDYIAQLYLGLTRLRPAEPAVSSKAFSLQEVTFALREGVDPKRVAALARERGVAFDLNKETESQLETVGANSLLLSELKKIRADNTKENRAGDAQRSRAAKELVDALNGLREWLDYTINYTTQGKFWDPPSKSASNSIFV